jgi:hypothetical protein
MHVAHLARLVTFAGEGAGLQGLSSLAPAVGDFATRLSPTYRAPSLAKPTVGRR